MNLDWLPTGFRMHGIEVNGARLAVAVGGCGAPVVLLHGWPETGRAWRHVMPGLAERYTVIVPDLRGCGGSERTRDGYEKAHQAEDVRQLTQALGHERTALVGHDIGGMVAWTLAARYPDQVSALVLIDLLLPGLGLEEAMDVARGGYWHFGFYMQPEAPELLIAGREQSYFAWWFRQMEGRPGAVPQDDVDANAAAYAGVEGLRAGFRHYRTLLKDGEDNRIQLAGGRKLAMPVLAIGGERSVGDRLVSSVGGTCADLRGETAPCGHFVAGEAPAWLLQRLVAFLADAEERRPSRAA